MEQTGLDWAQIAAIVASAGATLTTVAKMVLWYLDRRDARRHPAAPSAATDDDEHTAS